ncbi:MULTISPECIES: flagellar protein FliT [Vibrio]|jgi:flagellar rod protein FlaI|uniref:Flagellar protein FliT n=2 Tax=Vibrio TaxID=662 RepID=A0A2N7NHF4_9VIBR|nr:MULTISPECIES: flagellar protein FliT [Vibrio]EAQ54221.1 FlaI protein [Vibrio sp. MED222]OEF69114.1 flagellar rod protein FlaI [Vibrio tasmaniensis 1F-187]PMP13875.1 flagellar rod protein FlaI [Vibrio tasmaniensis]TKG29809.1 flagellar protein FliT [Vibrio tasmaniensis]TKG38962.1 flagellar protein FliT [Vibrio tasmaniensis]
MSKLLQELCELDQLIMSKLEFSEINAEEIVHLVDNREQLLQNVLQLIDSYPDVKQSSEWFEAISRTRQLVELMQSETGLVGKNLHKYRHAAKSVQQYKKFL